ncbi:MAG: flavodoxin family protein [Desulfitobacteriaceae bacterium]
MRILAINGSHRKRKNTAIMLEAVLHEARALGAETELLEITDFSIKPCSACSRCLRTPKCSIEDDMQLIASKMLEADAIVLGSPVYFGNVTGLMKTFMDRTRFLHMCDNVLEGKLGAGVTIAGLRNGGQETTLQILERFLQAHGLIIVDSRASQEGIYNLGAMGSHYNRMEEGQIKWHAGVAEDPLALRECRQLGRNLVKAIRRRLGEE